MFDMLLLIACRQTGRSSGRQALMEAQDFLFSERFIKRSARSKEHWPCEQDWISGVQILSHTKIKPVYLFKVMANSEGTVPTQNGLNTLLFPQLKLQISLSSLLLKLKCSIPFILQFLKKIFRSPMLENALMVDKTTTNSFENGTVVKGSGFIIFSFQSTWNHKGFEPILIKSRYIKIKVHKNQGT